MKNFFLSLSFYITIPIVAVALPIKASAGLVPDCGTLYACNFCDLVLMVSNVLNYIIYMSAPIAAIMFVYAGFLYLTSQGAVGKIQSAHSIFLNVAIGIFFILGAWLLVNFITSSLLKADLKDILSRNYTCTKTLLNAPTETPVPPTQPTPPTPPTPPATPTETGPEAEAKLKENNINITSSGNCNDKSLGICTSLDGIQTSTLDGIIKLANGCQAGDTNCKITVTGGTEIGHSQAHSDGKKMDLSKNDPAFNSFIETVLSKYQGQTISEGTKYSNVIYGGTTYTIIEEGNHWDIEITST